MNDELILLERARALDQEALGLIHDTYYQSIQRYISFRINDAATVEDLTSEVFVRFLAALRDRHAPRNTLRGWLFGVASRVIKEQYRQQQRAQIVPLDEAMPTTTPTPEQQAGQALANARLHRALGRLTDEQQNVLALRFGAEMPIKEVAQMMDKSVGAVKMLQARALAMLTEQLRGLEANS